MAEEIVVDIEKRFPAGATIRANFRLHLAAGSTAILFGPSGSGKTTVLRSIAGLERPERGVIRFHEEVLLDTSQGICRPPQSRNVGLLFQEYALFPHLTVRQNIEYGLNHRSQSERRQISDEMMQRFEIGDQADRRPRQISGGQAQRVALARALAPQPRILLLDEPLAALDVPTRARLRSELKRLLEQIRIPSLVVTHDRTEAITLGQQIVVMAEGDVRQVGCTEEVFRHPADATVADIVGVETILPGVVVETENGLARVQVGQKDISAVVRQDFGVGAKVLVCIRAEEVTLLPGQPVAVSSPNHFAGTIESIDSDGPIERVSVDCGFRLIAITTRNTREDLGLRVGVAATVSVNPAAVHLIRE